MGKVLKKSVGASKPTEKVEEKVVTAKTVEKPLKKGSLTDKANTPIPVKKAAVKAKVDQTVLKSGLTYGLLSRVRNAYPKEDRKTFEKDSKMMTMVDGRGQTHEISEAYVTPAEKVGGAEWLKTVRTSAVKKKLFPKGKTEKVSKKVESPEKK